MHQDGCLHTYKKMKKKTGPQVLTHPDGGFFYPFHTRALKGLRETLAAFPPPSWLGPKAGLITRSSWEPAASSAPPSSPSAGREPACLSRPIYHRHTNNTRESAETLPWSAGPNGSGRPAA